jgi:hypothetical protein
MKLSVILSSLPLLYSTVRGQNLRSTAKERRLNQSQYEESHHVHTDRNLTVSNDFQLLTDNDDFNTSISTVDKQTRAMASCSSNQRAVEIEIQTDSFGWETSWLFRPSGNNAIEKSPRYGSNQSYSHQFCVKVGMYEFIIKDLLHDGINGGYYKVSVQNKDGSWRVALKGSKFQGSKVTQLIDVGGQDMLMTERDRGYLEAHNVRRMEWHGRYNKEYVPLMWSNGLKKDAMEYAIKLLDTCTTSLPTHDPNNPYGENLARNRGSGSWGQLYSPDKILNRFVEREEGLPWARNGHLTNALWRATKYVGCAEAEKSYDVINARGYAVPNTCRVQVCRYAKPGNCSMGRYRDSAGKIDWLKPMLEDDSPCTPVCPPEGCYN